MIKQINVPISELYLDAENFRIIDKYEELKISSKDDIFKDTVQNKILENLIGSKKENISDLLQSFQSNGFININQIHAYKHSDNKYIIMEGNRRVATLKYIYDNLKKIELGKLDSTIFEAIPIALYEEKEKREHILLTGLDHITGKVKWSSKNQAEYLHKLIEQHGFSQKNIVAVLGGITLHEIRRSLRTFSLIKLYEKSDYSSDADKILFSLFREIIARVEIKNWLELKFNDEFDCGIIGYDEGKLEKIFSWISPDESKRKSLKKTPLSSETDIASLSKIIKDPVALDIFEETRDIQWASNSSGINARENVKKNLKKAYAFMSTVSEFSTFLDGDDVVLISDLEKIIKRIKYSSSNNQLNGAIKNKRLVSEIVKNHFQEISIESYKVLKNFKLQELNKINIIAGANNKGKTTILEAIYLLCNLNDPFGYLDILKKRGRHFEFPNIEWIDTNSSNLSLSAVFNSHNVKLTVKNEKESDEDIEKSRYLTSISLYANVETKEYSSRIRLFKPRETDINYKDIFGLCNITFISPFSLNLNEEAEKHYSASARFINKIILFIQEHIDNKIENIIYVPESNRFVVIKNKVEYDLTMFGSGLQFIFLTTIMFAYAQDGVVLIDEAENGIHFNLMKKYSLFLHKLTEEFNVQLFISSHSKELINAFINNNYKLENVNGYHILEDERGSLQSKKIAGKDFKKSVVNFDFDLRGDSI